MLGDISAVDNIYIITGYTDYPRRIIIRGDFFNPLFLNILCKYFSNNDISYILIVQTTMRRYFHNAGTE